MNKIISNVPETQPRLRGSAGFSVIELLAVIAVVGIVSTIGITSFRRSNRSLKVAGATRTLTTYLEKARIDAVRRHGGSSIVIDSATTYTVNIDFNGTGAITSRTITLPPGTTLSYTLPPAVTVINPTTTPRTIQYNWRGQTTNSVLITLTDANVGVASSAVVVGPGGGVSTGTTVTGPVVTPTPQNTVVTTTSSIKSMY